jgi:ATP:ADP antiporter, AAA family
MHIHAIFKSLLEIRREEWKRVILMFFYFYLTIASYYILKTVRNAYFVDRLGADDLPWVKIVIAFLTWIFVFYYSKVANKTILRNLINGSLLFLVLNLFFFWYMFDYKFAWLPFTFFIWVTIFNSLTVTQFWTFASDLFDSWEAKRVFGLVGAGGLIGGMTGSYIAAHFASIIGTRNLLLVAGGIIFLCVGIVSYLWKFELKKMTTAHGSRVLLPGEDGKDSKGDTAVGPFALIRRSRYLLYLLLLVGLTKFATELTEYQLTKMAEIHVTTGMDDLAAFFGKVFGSLNMVALVIQIFGTSIFLRYLGGASTLFLLPGGLLVGTLILLFQPAVWSISVLKIIDGSLRYSIYQSAKEFIYLPIQKIVRYKIKPFIDMFVYQLSKGLASIFVILINSFLFVYVAKYFPGEQTKVLLVGLLVLVSLIGWFWVVAGLKKEYPMAIREFLNRAGENRTLAEKEIVLQSIAEVRSQFLPLHLDHGALVQEIEKEVEAYEKLIVDHRLNTAEGVQTQDKTVVAQKGLLFFQLNRSIFRIFGILSLIYDAADMTLVCDNYIKGDEYTRANALELLELSLKPALKATLNKLLDGDLALANVTADTVV